MPVVEGAVSPESGFALSCAQSGQALGIPPASAPSQDDMHPESPPGVWPFSDKFDFATGGRYVDGPYSSSFFLQGAKYYDPQTGQLQLVVSTPQSNRLSVYRHSLPFNQFSVYTSHGPNHTRGGQGGMTFQPTFMTCDPHPRMFGDVFQQVEKYNSMEVVSHAGGIDDFHRFICGYHIHRDEKCLVDPQLCPLDWYYQTHDQYQDDADIFEHYLILDQVSPVDFWQGRITMYLGQYEWRGHQIGVDAAAGMH